MISALVVQVEEIGKCSFSWPSAKLLQRLLDDRKATVEMIQAEGGRIARSAEPADREKITGQLNSLGSHWASLLSKASAR